MKNIYPGGQAALSIQSSLQEFGHYFLLLTLLGLYCTTGHSQQTVEQEIKLVHSPVSFASEQKVRETLKKNSREIQFIENNGQSGLSASVIAYFSSFHETVFIERDRLRILVTEPIGRSSQTTGSLIKRFSVSTDSKRYRYSSFTILFSGAKALSAIKKINPFITKRTFLHSCKTDLSPAQAESFEELILTGIYPGIDLRLYSRDGGHLEFDWILQPGADPSAIKMKFIGQKNLLVAKDGHLQIGLGLGSFSMQLPESYYITTCGKQKAEVSFRSLGTNEVGFKGYDSRSEKFPLVIDPDLMWGTFFDGNNAGFDEYLYSIEYDYSNELIYCAGAANMQVTTAYASALSSAYDSTFEAVTDALIYSLSKNGEFITHITYLGGSGGDVAIGLSISPSFVYVCGYTGSTDFPVTLSSAGGYPAFDSTYHGANDGFVAVFNTRLDSLHYCSFLGGNGSDRALTIRAIADSSFYISLSVKDTLPVYAPDYIVNEADSIYAGNSEAWIGKFSSFNNLLFGTYVGGSSDDLINDFQVLSNGDIVFAGNTKNITEVNGYIPDNGTGQEALYGRITVPASGPVSFAILDKIGGSNNDFGWGIYSLGDSVSIMVGQTNSSNFPLGGGTVFQGTRAGAIDGFIAKIYNDGSPGYKATYTGGSADDILVSVRPVTVNHTIALLGWGSTSSTNLATVNFNSGSFFSNSNTGGLDMMFVICDMNFVHKYYLSYIGGSANDYLGITGAPVGSNHLFYNHADSVLYLGTTTHSSQTTHVPLFVGRGPGDAQNLGIPVFDETKGNTNNDTHVIIAISTQSLFVILPLDWVSVSAIRQGNCSVTLNWQTGNDENVLSYSIERSVDGHLFESIGSLSASAGPYEFTDRGDHLYTGRTYYRIMALEQGGRRSYSPIQVAAPCGTITEKIRIFPTVVSDHFTVSGLGSLPDTRLVLEIINKTGQLVEHRTMTSSSGTQTFLLQKSLASGNYIVLLRDAITGSIHYDQDIIIQH